MEGVLLTTRKRNATTGRMQRKTDPGF